MRETQNAASRTRIAASSVDARHDKKLSGNHKFVKQSFDDFEVARSHKIRSGMTELEAALVLRCHIRTVQLAAQIMRRGRPKPKNILAKNVGVYRLPICIAVDQV